MATDVDRILAEMRPHLERALSDARNEGFKEGLDEGYKKGGEDMRERIVAAATTPAEGAKPPTEPEAKTPAAPARPQLVAQERTPRGLVGQLVGAVLSDHPGLRIVDVERRAQERDPRVAVKSIGNELRRFKGKKYRRDSGGHWFLISHEGEKETAGPLSKEDPADSEDSNTETRHGAALV